jgi:hypothetical protein
MVYASLPWLNNANGVVSHLGPCFPLAGGLCKNFTQMPEENNPYSANHF